MNKKIMEAVGYKSWTPVQEAVLPILNEHHDVVVQAQTGTGKTAAFALPILNKIDVRKKNSQALVLTPTRELAIQVAQAFNRYGSILQIEATAIYGGQSYSVQEQALRKKPYIIVATPGRLVDMLKGRKINLKYIKTVILDEADEMLKMGFIDDVEWILDQAPQNRQTGLFSATIPKKIQEIASKYLTDPKSVIIKPKAEEVAQINQQMVHVKQKEKLDVLSRLLSSWGNIGTIIFVRTKNESMELSEKLCARGHAAAPINGDMNQAAREKAIERLRSAKLDILVATDVAARGIDVERIDQVVNYDMPFDLDSYIHRIGRTGRGGRTGTATLFATTKDRGLLRNIERKFGALTEISPPSHSELNQIQLQNLGEKALNVIQKSKRLKSFISWSESLLEKLEKSEVGHKEIIAALGYLVLQDVFFEEPSRQEPKKTKPSKGKAKSRQRFSKERSDKNKNFKKKNRKYT